MNYDLPGRNKTVNNISRRGSLMKHKVTQNIDYVNFNSAKLCGKPACRQAGFAKLLYNSF
jgi:hypothetical protein